MHTELRQISWGGGCERKRPSALCNSETQIPLSENCVFFVKGKCKIKPNMLYNQLTRYQSGVYD